MLSKLDISNIVCLFVLFQAAPRSHRGLPAVPPGLSPSETGETLPGDWVHVATVVQSVHCAVSTQVNLQKHQPECVLLGRTTTRHHLTTELSIRTATRHH